MNNSKTRLIGMSPAHAMTLEEVESKPSSKAKRAIGRYEEIKLKKGMAVRYLLKLSELEGDHSKDVERSYSVLHDQSLELDRTDRGPRSQRPIKTAYFKKF